LRKKILFICGSRNQTTQMHQISEYLKQEYDCWFTPFYATGHVEFLRKIGLTEMTIMGREFVERCINYFQEHDLNIDYQGAFNSYDAVITCADLVIPRNIRNKKLILVQEGMTDPENLTYYLAKYKLLPRWAASTATMGLSDAYDKFCIASEGYKELFIRKGVNPEKLIVTGIPNFDNCKKYLNNSFPHKNFVLVCTSDARETFKYENRKNTILNAVKIARGKPMIFKLHPNENHRRAMKEINTYAPAALIYTSGSAEEMIANCDTLITQFSSTVYVGIALGKTVYSNFDVKELQKLMPIQNNSSAKNIANVCRALIESEETKIISFPNRKNIFTYFKQVNYKQKFVQLISKAS